MPTGRPSRCPQNVEAFLDAYMERCVKPAGLSSLASLQSRVSVLKRYLGDLPLDAPEAPDEINAFKTESDYAEEVEIATVHRALELLRAAMNWGMAQTRPMFTKSPFHHSGVRMNKKLETTRDRRLTREEEKRLLDTALQTMNVGEHQFTGPLLHDRLIGAIERCCRRGEMLLIQNKRVNWETCQIGIPRATTKDKENRRVPFNPNGRLAAILQRRSTLGPDAFVFGAETGNGLGSLQRLAFARARLRVLTSAGRLDEEAWLGEFQPDVTGEVGVGEAPAAKTFLRPRTQVGSRDQDRFALRWPQRCGKVVHVLRFEAALCHDDNRTRRVLVPDPQHRIDGCCLRGRQAGGRRPPRGQACVQARYNAADQGVARNRAVVRNGQQSESGNVLSWRRSAVKGKDCPYRVYF